eukprot:751243-Pelagomonas_calceolata.AAC.2
MLEKAGFGDVVHYSTNVTLGNTTQPDNSTSSGEESGPLTMFVSSTEGIQALANLYAPAGLTGAKALEAFFNNPVAMREEQHWCTPILRTCSAGPQGNASAGDTVQGHKEMQLWITRRCSAGSQGEHLCLSTCPSCAIPAGIDLTDAQRWRSD